MFPPLLTFLGAAGTVTGSRFLVENGPTAVLVDAGLYQGPADLRKRNWEPFDRAREISEVVLTHAHLDHSGALPRLVRDGFGGRIFCTEETAELTAIVLRDSARLHEEDAHFANAKGFSRHNPALPLYDTSDVERTLPLLHPVPLGTRVEPDEGTAFTLHSAGHILGSATVELEVSGRRALFSGDLGRTGHPMVARREDPDAAETVVVESTYGDRSHADTGPSVLGDAVRRTIGRGGSVLVPAFAVDRTELVLRDLGQLMRSGSIPTVPVYVDSPMALAALDVYRRHLPAEAPDPDFGVPDLRVVHSVADSQLLNSPRRPCVVVSASGMATGGRVVHHLAQQLPNPRNCVVLTGFQAYGTRGRALAEGARNLKIHGRYVPVRAEVVVDTSRSVHADAGEIVEWLSHMPEAPRTVYVVHGEEQASRALARRIESELGWCAVCPRLGERVRLD